MLRRRAADVQRIETSAAQQFAGSGVAASVRQGHTRRRARRLVRVANRHDLKQLRQTAQRGEMNILRRLTQAEQGDFQRFHPGRLL